MKEKFSWRIHGAVGFRHRHRAFGRRSSGAGGRAGRCSRPPELGESRRDQFASCACGRNGAQVSPRFKASSSRGNVLHHGVQHQCDKLTLVPEHAKEPVGHGLRAAFAVDRHGMTLKKAHMRPRRIGPMWRRPCASRKRVNSPLVRCSRSQTSSLTIRGDYAHVAHVTVRSSFADRTVATG